MTKSLSPAATAPAAPATGPPPQREGVWWLPIPVVLAGTFMVILDFFIVNVAISAIQHDLHATSADIQFIVAGYGVAYGAGQILAGRMGDRFGRRTMYVAGIALFTLASAACGLAPTTLVLIVARVVQGIGAATLSPQVLSSLGLLYEGTRRARAFTAYGMVMGVAAVGGQLAGGLLIKADIFGLSWKMCFLINVPIGLVALLCALRVLPNPRTGGRKLDLMGALLVTAGLVAVVLPLVEGRELGWPPWTIAVLAASAVILSGFVLHQHRRGKRAEPLIDLTLFRERVFSVGLASILVLYSGVASFFLVLALYLQLGRGYSPLESGVIFSVMGIAFFITSLLANGLVAKLGRHALTIGMAGMAVGLVGLTVAEQAIGQFGPIGLILAPIVVYGAGLGLVMAPLNTLVLTQVAPRHAGSAAGTLTTMIQVGNAVGVALIGILFYGSLARNGTAPQDYRQAFSDSAVLLIALALACAVLSQFMRPSRTRAATAPQPAATGLSGRVVDRDSGPFAGAALTLIDRSGRQLGRARTDADGRYTLPDIADGAGVLLVAAPERRPEAFPVTVADGVGHQDITLYGTRNLTGTVHTAGAVVPNAAVTLADAVGRVIDHQVSDPQGTYTFTGLNRGDYTVVAHDTDGPAAHPVTVDGAETTRNDIAVSRKATLAGRVTGPDGEPTTGAMLTLLATDGRPVSVRTADIAGRFAFGEVPAGSYTLVANGYSPRACRVDVDGGGQEALDIRLAFPGSTSLHRRTPERR